MSCCGLDLTFGLAVVTWRFKILSGLYISDSVRCKRLIFGMDTG